MSDELEMTCKVRAIGWPWFGVVRVRVFFDDVDYRTFYHLCLTPWLTIGGAFPPVLMNLSQSK